ncbi:polymorphic toxin type 15 domain-containing protein [Nocardia sp. BMG111209]|uniref:polymorphic toxin type 15 domain-containing protein n=1 Tax=Nocardia sp. BMG111209 TaxID=1160137 RepID=UPI0003A4E928|nr:polymorphic toxin type 15 domain-containing protein [Nocardia sp. BMG111209]
MSEGGALGAAVDLARTRLAEVVERIGRVMSEAVEGSSQRVVRSVEGTVAVDEATVVPAWKAYSEQKFIVKNQQTHPINNADGSKWEALGANNSGSEWAADHDNVKAALNNSGELTDRVERILTLNFKEGATPGTQNKLNEYRRQVDRQLDGVNRLSSREILDNWQHVERVGTAQRVAREEYETDLYERKLYEALEMDGRGELNGRSPEDYAQQQVAAEMAKKRALHEQDLAGGGADRIGVLPDGTWSMGDKYVNSSLGSQWKTLRNDLRDYAEQLHRSGDGKKLLNVRWRVG